MTGLEGLSTQETYKNLKNIFESQSNADGEAHAFNLEFLQKILINEIDNNESNEYYLYSNNYIEATLFNNNNVSPLKHNFLSYFMEDATL
jgi:hypothetical protein